MTQIQVGWFRHIITTLESRGKNDSNHYVQSQPGGDAITSVTITSATLTTVSVRTVSHSKCLPWMMHTPKSLMYTISLVSPIIPINSALKMGRDTWLAQSVECLTWVSAHAMIPGLWDQILCQASHWAWNLLMVLSFPSVSPLLAVSL